MCLLISCLVIFLRSCGPVYLAIEPKNLLILSILQSENQDRCELRGWTFLTSGPWRIFGGETSLPEDPLNGKAGSAIHTTEGPLSQSCVQAGVSVACYEDLRLARPHRTRAEAIKFAVAWLAGR